MLLVGRIGVALKNEVILSRLGEKSTDVGKCKTNEKWLGHMI